MMQLAVCGGTQSLASPPDTAATIAARLILMSTLQRASPKLHLTSRWSASLRVDFAQVLVRAHFRSSPLGFFCCSMPHRRLSQASMALASSAPSSRALAEDRQWIEPKAASASTTKTGRRLAKAAVEVWCIRPLLPRVSCCLASVAPSGAGAAVPMPSTRQRATCRPSNVIACPLAGVRQVIDENQAAQRHLDRAAHPRAHARSLAGCCTAREGTSTLPAW